jgi:hypothetical protein
MRAMVEEASLIHSQVMESPSRGRGEAQSMRSNTEYTIGSKVVAYS